MVDHPKLKLTESFNSGQGGEPPKHNASAGGQQSPPQGYKPVAMPVSKIQIADLKKRLSMPRIALEFTPQGAATKQVRSNGDKSILDEIRRQHAQLNKRNNTMKEAFDRANENKTIKRGPKR